MHPLCCLDNASLIPAAQLEKLGVAAGPGPGPHMDGKPVNIRNKGVFTLSIPDIDTRY